MLSINRFFENLPNILSRNRGKSWIIFIVLTAFFAVGMGRFKLEMSMVSFFKEGEPVKNAYDRFRAIFGGNEAVYIVYEAKDGDVFSPASLKAVRGVQEELLNSRFRVQDGNNSSLAHITDVDTIVNASYLESSEDTLISREFIGNRIPTDKVARDQLEQLARRQPGYPKLYFSDDLRFGGIMIKTDFNAIPEESALPDASDELDDQELQFDDSDELADEVDVYANDYLPRFKKTPIKDYLPFMDEISAILEKKAYSDHLVFYPVGNPPLMAYAFKNMMIEMGLIMIGSLLLIILVLWGLFRSFSAVVWPVAIIVLSMVWVMGCIGWSGLAMTEMYNIIIFLVLAVGVADAIHMLSGYQYYRFKTLPHQEALRIVYRKSGLACFLTSITTALGLLSMVFVPIVPLQRFAVFAAFGVMAAFVVSVFMLPLMLDVWNPISKRRAARIIERKGSDHLIQRFIRRFEELSFSDHFYICCFGNCVGGGLRQYSGGIKFHREPEGGGGSQRLLPYC